MDLYVPYSNLRAGHNEKKKGQDFRKKPGDAFELLLDPG